MSENFPALDAPQFAVAVRGYDRAQVESYVAELHARLQETRDRLAQTETANAETVDALHAKIAELQDNMVTAEHARLERTQPDFRGLGERMIRILELAQTEADAIRDRAAREAEETVARARREAERATEGEREKQEALQRQLRALHDNLESILGVLPAGVAAAAGVDASAAEEPAVIDLLDDSTQVVQVIPAGPA